MNADKIKINTEWREVLRDEFEKPYFSKLRQKLLQDKQAGKLIYPSGSKIFNAFDSTPFSKAKVIILGQDPYHGPGQAMGLSFSVPRNIKIPPSLRNIHKELHNDLSITPPDHGDLSTWAKRGVFLLNAILTVEHKKPGSHSKIGWETFTDAVIEKLSDERENLVFLLWGRFARSKASLIDSRKHQILESAHPSPLAGNAFMNNHHFSKANNALTSKDIEPIDWSID